MKKVNKDVAEEKVDDLQLDAEEKEILKMFESGKYTPVSNVDEEIAIAREAAKNTLSKDARINIRISSVDLEHIKRQAAYEGLPYQTLIASILHKYAAGHL